MWFETRKGKTAKRAHYSYKLYHKTTWFETEFQALLAKLNLAVANYITKLRGLKQTPQSKLFQSLYELQIISQNYAV